MGVRHAILALLVLPMAGCFGPKPFPEHEPLHTRTVTSAEMPYVEAMNDFTFEFARSAGVLNSRENELISPFGVYQALSVLYAGSEGDTFTRLTEALRIPHEDREAFLESQRAILNQVKANEQLQVANGIWMIWPIEVDSLFARDVSAALDADVYKVGSARTGARDEINRWVRQRTDGMVDELVRNIDPEVMFIVTNAVALDAKWKNPFEERQTRQGTFQTPAGERLADFMHGEFEANSSHVPGEYSALQLNYRGDRLSFVAVLPDVESTLSELTSRLSATEWGAILDNLEPRQELSIAIPRFRFRSRFELGRLVGNTIGDIEQGLDLRYMASELSKTYLGDVYQESYIEVFEQGTRAASATALEGTASAPLEMFLANRPFLFAIIENETGLILMLGVVNEP